MNASQKTIFDAVAQLELWPTFLPHYRSIEYIQKSPNRNIVKMSANRDSIPVSWVAEQVIDRQNVEVRFKHLSAWTKGMEVVWKFQELSSGIRVEIVHDLKFRFSLLAPIAEPIIGEFFIQYIADQTLKHMKTHVEQR
jgi:ribosome-associated toxin RatA of RatAB toxin-antitoxin module